MIFSIRICCKITTVHAHSCTNQHCSHFGRRTNKSPNLLLIVIDLNNTNHLQFLLTSQKIQDNDLQLLYQNMLWNYHSLCTLTHKLTLFTLFTQNWHFLAGLQFSHFQVKFRMSHPRKECVTITTTSLRVLQIRVS